MAQFWLILAVALTAGAILFGIVVLAGGDDRGLRPVEPDGRSVPLPGRRPLVESDFTAVRFEVAVRGYRMGEVDAALRRAAYDIGYKGELIEVLEAEVEALRAGRTSEADALRRAREAALAPVRQGAVDQVAATPGSADLGSTALDTVDPAPADAATTDPEATDPEATDPESVDAEVTGSEPTGEPSTGQPA